MFLMFLSELLILASSMAPEERHFHRGHVIYFVLKQMCKSGLKVPISFH